MKLPNPNPTSGMADASDVYEAQKRLVESADKLASMTVDEALARTVIEFNSDRMKRALARAMSASLKGGDSAAKAEAEGRGSSNYAAELKQLEKEYQAAMETHVIWDAQVIQWKTSQSILSVLRQTIGNV